VLRPLGEVDAHRRRFLIEGAVAAEADIGDGNALVRFQLLATASTRVVFCHHGLSKLVGHAATIRAPIIISIAIDATLALDLRGEVFF
jgi:hypothetical protein